MRVIVELHRSDTGTLHGIVITGPEDNGEAHRFSGWLDLLRVLEALAPPETPTSAGGSTAEPP